MVLFRHGKSDWHTDYGPDDHDRPLSRRGRRAAEVMGRFLAGVGQVPDLAVTSPAVRARRTLELAVAAGGWTCQVQQQPRLYDQAVDLLSEVRSAPDEVRSVMLVGHEPAWSAGAQLLTGAKRIRLPTAAMLRLEVEAESWGDLKPAMATILWLMVPRLAERGWLERVNG